MNKVSRDTLRKSTKHLMVISTIATLLIAAMSLTTTTNASAFNFGLLSKDNNLGSIDTNSLFSYVGAAINCVNENEENNNVIANNNEETPIPPPPEEPGTLTVIKEVVCRSVDGDPSDQAVCDYAVNSVNFPEPSDYPIAVAGNDPNPSTFPGSSTGTPVEIGPGNYVITEELVSTGALQAEMGAQSIIQTTTATGDCTPNFSVNNVFIDATGTMTSGGSQECTIVNTVNIFDGTVPADTLTD
jgi:hypothetical protein